MRYNHNVDDVIANQPQFSDWDSEKNNPLGLNPKVLLKGSNKEAWWICEKGHSYKMRIKSRMSSQRACPMCAGRQAIIGETDLFSTNPELQVEWDFDKNNEFDPKTLMANSKKKVWWKCSNNHSWETSIQNRAIHGMQCPQCTPTNAIKEWTPLSKSHPELLTEWDYEKNNEIGLDPTRLTYGSTKKAWWQCKEGHSWQALISNRARQHRQCPYCTGQKPIVGKNDLATTHPELAEEWDFEKNTDITMQDIFAGSHVKVWWKCLKCGHSYLGRVDCRTISSVGQYCPLCNNRVLISGKNDLASKCPELMEEWVYDKNKELGLDPTQVYYGERVMAWWRCKTCGSYWKTEIRNRSFMKAGCLSCLAGSHSSFPERAVYYYVRKHIETALCNHKIEFGRELDIYIPNLQVAIEYDGAAWHGQYQQQRERSQNRDRQRLDDWKNEYCIQNGIKLIRIREVGCYSLETPCIIYSVTHKDKTSLNRAISLMLLEQFNITDNDIDVIRDEADIIAHTAQCRKEKSLAYCYPDIAKSWHPTKNKDMTPEMVLPTSVSTVWWLCDVCHNEYQAEIRDKAILSKPCPHCKKMFGIPNLRNSYKARQNTHVRRLAIPPQTRSLPK